MKTQMRFQRILMLISLILAALTCVYALGFFTGSLASIYSYTAESQNDIINAEECFTFSQSTNSVLMFMGIACVIAVVLMYITATQKRRNYYIDNYVTIGIAVLYEVVFAIVAIALIAKTSNLFYNDIDWVKYENEIADTTLDHGRDMSGTMFALGYVLFVIILLDAAALVLNTIWKIKLMKGEKELLQNGLAKEVA